LTKLHEQVTRGSLAELGAAVADGSIPARGEFALVVAGLARGAGTDKEEEGPDAATVGAARTRVAAMVREGRSRPDAARLVAAETGLSRRALYRTAEGEE